MDNGLLGLAALEDWVRGNQALLRLLGTASLVLLATTALALPVIVAKLPRDYFTRRRRELTGRVRKRPLLWGFATLLKNALGVVLILAGLAMLVLPGQGAITILIGLALTNFPGKYAIERRIVSQPAIGKTLNRIRDLAGQPPLSLPAPSDGIEESTN